MTLVQLRKKLHGFIDAAEEKKLKALYVIVEDDIASGSLLTAEQKAELDKRLDEYLKNTGTNYSWDEAVKKIRKPQPERKV
ncbi:MAG TPA: addiction module protein [Bacteroidia bacterium]|nr:addiction module protein [Bacteroidia bacterium]